MTAVRYVGPAGQSNIEVGQATEEGDFLEPGEVYDLPPELAERLVETNAAWEWVQDFDELPLAQLREMASDMGLSGLSGKKKDEVVAAIREARERGVRAESESAETGVATPNEASGEGSS